MYTISQLLQGFLGTFLFPLSISVWELFGGGEGEGRAGGPGGVRVGLPLKMLLKVCKWDVAG